MKHPLVALSTRYPRRVFWLVLALTLAAAALIPRIQVDTDPENMLAHDQPDRLLHDQIKARFGLSDVVVVGMVNERGIFNPQSLTNLYQLTRAIERIDGVIARDLMSLAASDNISQQGPGTIRFSWMMEGPVETEADAERIRAAVQRLPMMTDTLVSADEKAAGIYVPIVSKDESYRIANEIRALIGALPGDDQFHITGLPVAEDTFGVEMFIQMAVSAPLAGLAIFLLMWWFFRSVALITAPMLMAMAVVIITMGALIGAGYTVHIMSSMIPIFLMPIAVVDSVHLLSEFADRYRPGEDVRARVHGILDHLFTPMLYTSITSAAGFLSLAFTPIPPVQVFGVFVAIGILLAFLFTVTFIPAYIVSLSPARLEAMASRAHGDESVGALAAAVRGIGRISVARARLLTLLFAALVAAGVFGISKIQINDNPVRWFEPDHDIRVADRVLNSHFAGTYEAFLVLDQQDSSAVLDGLEDDLAELLNSAPPVASGVWREMIATGLPADAEGLTDLISNVDERLFEAEDEAIAFWEALLDRLEQAATEFKAFQRPDVLRYMADLEAHLVATGLVGKSNSVVSLVKTVYRELSGGDPQAYRIPDSPRAVAQTLLSFQSSHRPDDLWHMVTPDMRAAAIWLQLSSGDNQHMSQVVEAVEDYVASHPLPAGMQLQWGGLTYINVIWQEAMVSGMLDSLLSAFVVVLVMMVVLFRSLLFGLLAMVPLTVTIIAIYGLIGFVGKDYDMPVAVLSALTLGLSVDFAIHFLQRTRSLVQERGSYRLAITEMFEEPGRAISRNAIVIAIGFLPLLAAPLVPYQTVGLFLAAIMAVSCLVTMMALPALFELLKGRLFPGAESTRQGANS